MAKRSIARDGVSSNSYADAPARRLVAAALDVLAREAPAHHDELRHLVSAVAMNLFVGDEAFALRSRAGDIELEPPLEDPRLVVTTSLDAACALLDARRTLRETIDRGELDLQGSADAMDTAASAFAIALHGLVRAPSSPALLEALRRQVGDAR